MANMAMLVSKGPSTMNELYISWCWDRKKRYLIWDGVWAKLRDWLRAKKIRKPTVSFGSF